MSLLMSIWPIQFYPVQLNFWFYWFVFCGIIMGRYLITAGGVYYILRSRLGKWQPKMPPDGRSPVQRIVIAEDIKLSTLSTIFFALAAACFMVFYQHDLTQIYTRISGRIDGDDLAYLVVSYGVVLLLQDTYFYFIHRLFHHPWLFKWFHQGHHRSTIPTPWTSFAFDPLEAAIQASFLLGIALIMPLHFGVLIALLLTMTVWSVGNHLGFQAVPSSMLSRWWGSWCIGSAHHLLHHRRYNRHYGLYFTFWDRILGTQDEDYEMKRSRQSSV